MNLKTAYEPYFKIGAAISRKNLHTAADMKLLNAQFNSFTCENDMKPMYYLDEESCKSDPDKYELEPALTFEKAKPYLEAAKADGIAMRGHTLVWHNQTPKWFFCQHYNENFPLADRDTMLARLESYIRGVLNFVQTEYPDIIYAWDVVNEAVDEGDFRKSLWTKTVGNDFVIKAFEYARKYDAEGVDLFYNDYETALEWKRDFIIANILKPLQEKGLVDGMGMQSHLLMDHPKYEDYRTALEMYGALGLKINITELDMHNADPSEESMKALAGRYAEFFRIYVDAKKSGKANVTSVTFWNLKDEDSWLSGFRRETSYPLLFRGKSEAKEAYYAVLRVVVPDTEIDKWEADYPDEDYEMTGFGKPEINSFRKDIWNEGEYDYAASYGFTPNVFAYLHTDDEKRDCMLVVPGGGYCMVVPHEAELAAMEFYDRGVKWTSESLSVKGTSWKAAYLPVWLYSYYQTDKKLMHYVAVNARTGETMGSVPINKTRLMIVSAIVEVIGVVFGLWWFKFWIGVDVDDDNPAIWGFLGFTPGFIFYWIQTSRYRNMGARHLHEKETRSQAENIKSTDTLKEHRKRLRNSRIQGENGNSVQGVLAKNGEKMMGEKMANFIGIGRMAGSTPDQTPIGQKTIADAKGKGKKVNTATTIIVIIIILFILFAIMG